MFNNKKKHFQRKYRGVEQMIWDLEFKRFKTQEIREEIRQKYDNDKARLSQLLDQIKDQGLKPTMEAGEIARLDDQRVLMEKGQEDLERQLKGCDLEVQGSPKTNEYPEGIQGLNQQIENLQELKLMVRDWIKQL